MKRLCSLIEQLEAIDKNCVINGQSALFVEIRESNNEIVVAGNQEGLVHLALQLLRLAEAKHVGSHFHLDESSVADTAEKNIVFSYRAAPWS